MICLQFLHTVEQGLEGVPEEAVSNDNIGIMTLNRCEQAVEQRSLGFNCLERRSLGLSAGFEAGWEFLDGTDDGIQLTGKSIRRCVIVDIT